MSHKSKHLLSKDPLILETDGALLECEHKLADSEAQLKRALADYANLQTRMEKEKAAFRDYAFEDLLKRFLPAADILQKGFDSTQDVHLKQALDFLRQTLADIGVSMIEALGKPFDPTRHEAIERTGEGDLVTAVHGAGYLWKDKVLRPARVSVGSLKTGIMEPIESNNKTENEGGV